MRYIKFPLFELARCITHSKHLYVQCIFKCTNICLIITGRPYMIVAWKQYDKKDYITWRRIQAPITSSQTALVGTLCVNSSIKQFRNSCEHAHYSPWSTDSSKSTAFTWKASQLRCMHSRYVLLDMYSLWFSEMKFHHLWEIWMMGDMRNRSNASGEYFVTLHSARKKLI